MRKRKIIVCISLASLLVLVVSLSGCIFRFDENIYEYTDAEYEADENTVLEVSNINGLVNVTGWDGDTVYLKIVKSVKERYGEDEFEKVEVNVNEIGNKLCIETVYLENNAHVAVFMDIKVPMYVTVESVQTINGGVYLTNLKGDVQIDVTNGYITVCGVDGYVAAKTANGPITIRDTTGVSDIVTLNGVIDVEVYDFKEDIEISTINGVMDIFINPELDANLEIESKSIAGIFSLNDMTPLLDVTRFDSRHIEATLNEGGNKIYMTITSGFIDLHRLTS